MSKLKGLGTTESPWLLKTPPGTSDYQAYEDEAAEPPALVVQVGKTQLRYHAAQAHEGGEELRESR